MSIRKKEILIMTDDQKLLKEINKTAVTGLSALNALLPVVKKTPIKQTLTDQIQRYEIFHQKAKDALESQNMPEESNGMLNQLNKMNIKMQARMNSTPTHIASMMIQGSDMGVIALQKARNHTPNANYEHKKLADEMLDFEKETIEAYKKYL